MYGIYGVAFSLMEIAVTVTPFRRGDSWAWWALGVGNALTYVAAMRYDWTVKAIGPFELTEYLGLAAVYLALAVTVPWKGQVTPWKLESTKKEISFDKERKTMDEIFDPKTLAEDLAEVHRIYSRFFATMDETNWNKPVKGSPKEWDLHEIVAHLVALNGAGLESIKHTLRGESYTFVGLEDRYKFNAWNRKGIDEHLDIPMKDLCAQALNILEEATLIARDLSPDQAKITAQMPIYNRPVSIAEALSIIIFHVGLAHAAQVAEPAGVPPLWLQHSPQFRHRVIGRVMRAFSLLYRLDIGGSLRDTIVFPIDGPDGGEWYVKLSPDAPTSGEGPVEHPGLVIHLRETAVFCQMLTGRFNLLIGLTGGAMKLRGDLRLFLRMSTLFSIDARPQVVTKEKHYPLPST